MSSRVAFAVFVIAFALTPSIAAGQPPDYALAGRNRLEVLVGMRSGAGHADGAAPVVAGVDNSALVGGLQFTRWFSEKLAFTTTASALSETNVLQVASTGTVADSSSVTMVTVGARWNLLRGDMRRHSAKPYLSASVGPVFGSSSGVVLASGSVQAGSSMETAVGGLVGGGVDVHVGRRWSFGVEGGYRWMSDFSRPVGGVSNYRGFQLTAGFGWVFGRGY